MHFKPSQRHYATISACAPEDDPQNPFITPQTEAFAILAYENNYDRNLRYVVLKNKYPNCWIVPAKFKKNENGKKVEPTTEEHQVIGDKCYSCYGPNSRGKYFIPDAGQDQFGGWKNEGLHRYNELVTMAKNGKLVTMAKNGRKSPNCIEVETKSLEQVRQNLGLTAASHKQELAKTSTKRVNNNKELVDTWQSEDESDADGSEKN